MVSEFAILTSNSEYKYYIVLLLVELDTLFAISSAFLFALPNLSSLEISSVNIRLNNLDALEKPRLITAGIRSIHLADIRLIFVHLR